MAKGWEHFSTVNDARVETKESKKARAKRTERIMRTTPTLSEEDLKKASNERYAIKVAQEDSLVVAYDEKRLKSKKLIKQARYIKKMREEAEKKLAAAAPKSAEPESSAQ